MARVPRPTRKNHRIPYTLCPFCSYMNAPEIWDQQIVSVSLRIICGKHDSGIVWSECLGCHSFSWVHKDLTWIRSCSYIEPAMRTKSDREYQRRRTTAIREWGSGLCCKCKLLETAVSDTSARRTCIIGCGPPVQECDSFVPIESITLDSKKNPLIAEHRKACGIVSKE